MHLSELHVERSSKNEFTQEFCDPPLASSPGRHVGCKRDRACAGQRTPESLRSLGPGPVATRTRSAPFVPSFVAGRLERTAKWREPRAEPQAPTWPPRLPAIARALATLGANPSCHVTSPGSSSRTPQHWNTLLSFQIWDSYFYLAVIFINQLCLQLEMFTPSKKKKVLEK